MSKDRLNGMIARITPFEAVNIDALLAAHDPRARDGGRDVFPEGVGRPAFRPLFRDESTVAIGVRVNEARDDLAVLAAQLASLAMEQSAEVIVLSTLDYSGLERFGFRCERICGETDAERQACERQVIRFWNLEIII